ncbi:MAG: cytidine deaminase [Vulcanimicrobiaceae bacterium]
MTDRELLDAARSARAHAYAPYSGYDVGAALLCANGTVASGCNVENASYGLSLCAERSALAVAIASGRRDFVALAICGPDDATTPPCGACRQVLAEFGGALRVLYAGTDGLVETTVAALLPSAFALP